MTEGFKKYIEETGATVAKVFNYEEIVPAHVWAEETRRMEGGRRYRFSFAPYQKEMMETPFDPNVQMTVFQMASRLGKTEVCMNIIGHAIDEAPRRILALYPTTSQAEKWSKETLEKELLAPTPSLRFLERGGRRDSSNTILHKLFPGGLLNVFGGNAPGELRRAKGNLLFADEVSALQSSEKDEGDQLEIFWTRGSEYRDTIRIAASYPSVEGLCRISQLLASSDCRKWHTPCIHCGKEYVMIRDHLQYPEGKPELAVLICPHCGEGITDKQRREMVMNGRWIATREFTGIAGFHSCGMLSPHPVQRGYHCHLHWVASQEEKIEKSDNPDRARHVLTNTFDAEPYKPEVVEAPDANALLDRVEYYKPREMLPDGVLIVTAGVDVQKRYLECSVWGWGENKESWLLEHRMIQGAPDDPATWSEMEGFLGSCSYPHPCGANISLLEPGSRVFVDAGHWDQHVLPWTFSKQLLGVAAVQGSPTVNAPILGKVRFGSSPKARIYPVGVNQAKDILYARLSLAPSSKDSAEVPPGYVHLNRAATHQYIDGLTCEFGKEEIFRGESFTRYVCPPGKRNEPLDCFVYAFAARVAVNPRFDRVRENMERGTKKESPQAKTKKRTIRKPRKKPGFIGGFRP